MYARVRTIPNCCIRDPVKAATPTRDRELQQVKTMLKFEWKKGRIEREYADSLESAIFFLAEHNGAMESLVWDAPPVVLSLESRIGDSGMKIY